MKTGAFILASGSSGRTTEVNHKSLLSFNGTPLIIYQIRETLKVIGNINVILGSQGEKIQTFCQNNLDENELKNINFHLFNDWKKGRSHSLSFLAMNALKLHLKWTFLISVDQPVSEEILLNLMKNISEETDVIIPVNNDKRGHPVLVNSITLEEIRKLKDYDNLTLSDILKKMRIKEVNIPNPYIHLNLNTLDDFGLDSY